MLLDYTLEELMVEYLEDLIEVDPMAAYPTPTTEAGIAFTNTGDPVIDKFERDFATGKSVTVASMAEDLGLSPEKFTAWLKTKRKPAPPTEEAGPPPEEFRDTYGGG